MSGFYIHGVLSLLGAFNQPGYGLSLSSRIQCPDFSSMVQVFKKTFSFSTICFKEGQVTYRITSEIRKPGSTLQVWKLTNIINIIIITIVVCYKMWHDPWASQKLNRSFTTFSSYLKCLVRFKDLEHCHIPSDRFFG